MKFNSIFDAINKLPEKIDYFLMCASYEDRSMSFYDYVDVDRVRNFELFYFEEFLNFTSYNINKYEEKFHINKHALNISNPISMADRLTYCFSNITGIPNIVVDISTFTRESLLILLKFISLNRKKFSKIYLFYRCAEVASELSSMVAQIRSVLGFMGNIELGKPLHLILLNGFETQRAKEMIDTIEPDFISIGSGAKEKSISDNLYDNNKNFTEQLIAYYRDGRNINSFNYSLIDSNEVKNTILSIVNRNLDHNYVLVPLSNKLSTVGAGLAGLENDAIQLCYSEVSNYNIEGYSKALDICFIEELVL